MGVARAKSTGSSVLAVGFITDSFAGSSFEDSTPDKLIAAALITRHITPMRCLVASFYPKIILSKNAENKGVIDHMVVTIPAFSPA